MKITSAQRRLIEFLISETSGNAAVTARRWGAAAGEAKEYARTQNRLLLIRDWTADVVLDPEGESWLIDTDGGQPARITTPEERHGALFRGLYPYPELLSLLPARPADAVTCPQCEGTGMHPAVYANPALRSIICPCSGAGWTVVPPSS